jgi:hypothetical protein
VIGAVNRLVIAKCPLVVAPSARVIFFARRMSARLLDAVATRGCHGPSVASSINSARRATARPAPPACGEQHVSGLFNVAAVSGLGPLSAFPVSPEPYEGGPPLLATSRATSFNRTATRNGVCSLAKPYDRVRERGLAIALRFFMDATFARLRAYRRVFVLPRRAGETHSPPAAVRRSSPDPRR